ncbi:MAG: signal recognition particle-docking protein FtsY [Magnetococcales bacterium]|nr:signal recognition particle-docking protein FtsY [Magnetococcales bacterium]
MSILKRFQEGIAKAKEKTREKALEGIAKAKEKTLEGVVRTREKTKQGLAKTRQGFTRRLDGLIPGREVDEDLIEDLEGLLITADFGVESTGRILAEAQKRLKKEAKQDGETLREMIRLTVLDSLISCQTPWELTSDKKPHVILVVGVNGVGKTTTIGKLAAHLKSADQDVVLAAGDTFRAAAVNQLKIWGERAGCPVISQGDSADSASVVFDAYASAAARGADFLLADTAGRLHTKVNLMEELKKIKRVLSRKDETAPHDILLVLDATTGQNAVSQVRQFHEALGLTGLVVTKLDGTAKGGVVVNISEQFQLPIRHIGVGEGITDLRPFSAEEFVEALFDAG